MFWRGRRGLDSPPINSPCRAGDLASVGGLFQPPSRFNESAQASGSGRWRAEGTVAAAYSSTKSSTATPESSGASQARSSPGNGRYLARMRSAERPCRCLLSGGPEISGEQAERVRCWFRRRACRLQSARSSRTLNMTLKSSGRCRTSCSRPRRQSRRSRDRLNGRTRRRRRALPCATMLPPASLLLSD